MINAKDKCVFSSDRQGTDNEITELDFSNGWVSEDLYNNYDYWSSLNSIDVTVISVIAAKMIGGCTEYAKVYITKLGTDYQFTVPTRELVAIGSSSEPPNLCNCALSLIMTRGCQCGGG